MVRDGLFAADHQAVAAILACHAAASADVDVVHAGISQAFGSPHVVAVKRIASVNNDVGDVQVRRERFEFVIDDAGWHHEPDRARSLQL
jgi:hypothetical protein